MITKDVTSPNEIILEFKKCYDDMRYFISNYIKIPVFGTGDFINLVPYPSQEQYLNALDDIWTKQEKNGIIFLASRQCGKTQLTEAVIVWLTVFRSNYPVVLMSRSLEQGKSTMQEILDMIKRLPKWMIPLFKKQNAEKFVFTNNSSITLQASNKSRTGSKGSDKGRGMRAMFLWVDEGAFVPLSDHMASIIPTISKTFVVAKKLHIPYGIVISSTPQGQTGVGEGFFKMWTTAYNTPLDSSYIAVRLHWSQIPDYDEKWYKERCNDLDNDQRRINQEYELVFLGDNNSLFDDATIKLLMDESKAVPPIQTISEPHGTISWWTIPNNYSKYLVGIDIATQDGKDYSVIEVYDGDTLEQVCEACFKCPTLTFQNVYIPKVVDILKNKLIIPERNSVGTSICESLVEKYKTDVMIDIFDSGFQTLVDKFPKVNDLFDHSKRGLYQNMITRPLLLEQLYIFFREHSNLFKSKHLRLQAASLRATKSGKFEGFPNDDLCLATGFILLIKRQWDVIMKYHFDAAINAFDVSDIQDQLDAISCTKRLGIEDSPFFNEQVSEYLEYKRHRYNRQNTEDIFSSLGR